MLGLVKNCASLSYSGQKNANSNRNLANLASQIPALIMPYLSYVSERVWNCCVPGRSHGHTQAFKTLTETLGESKPRSKTKWKTKLYINQCHIMQISLFFSDTRCALRSCGLLNPFNPPNLPIYLELEDRRGKSASVFPLSRHPIFANFWVSLHFCSGASERMLLYYNRRTRAFLHFTTFAF